MAQYVRVPHASSSLYLIPDKLESIRAVFVGDILSTGYFGAQLSEIRPNNVICVIGAGPCGLCAAMCASRLFGADVYIVEVNIVRRKFKAEWLHHDIYDVDEMQSLADALPNGGFDSVIECAGADSTL